MKKLVLSVCIAVAIPTLVNAQGFLDKMKKFAGTSDTLGVWKNSENYMIEGAGSITLLDGTKQDGTVQFDITEMNKTLSCIYFTPASEMKPKKMTDDDIQYFTVKGKDFYPVRMKEDDINVGHKTIFMEMLNASANDKFKMYSLRKLEKSVMPNSTKPYDLKTGFYVMLPEFKNAHEIVDLTFTPFAKKMSEYLKDCPELAKKIEDKEKGYKYNMFNGAANNEVFFKIMEEYNACGK
jgi:hypothetical protein